MHKFVCNWITCFAVLVLLFLSSSSVAAKDVLPPATAITYDADGEKIMQRCYEYDEAGNKTTLRLWTKGTEGNGWVHRKYTYDEADVCTGCSIYDEKDSLLGSWIYEYGKDGKNRTEYAYDIQKNLTGYTVNEFDGQYNLIRKEEFWADGSRISGSYYEIQYDEEGKMVSAIRQDSEGDASVDTVETDAVLNYKWNTAGNLVLEQEYRENELVSYTEYLYE